MRRPLGRSVVTQLLFYLDNLCLELLEGHPNCVEQAVVAGLSCQSRQIRVTVGGCSVGHLQLELCVRREPLGGQVQRRYPFAYRREPVAERVLPRVQRRLVLGQPSAPISKRVSFKEPLSPFMENGAELSVRKLEFPS
jgi:hypothetical protein